MTVKSHLSRTRVEQRVPDWFSPSHPIPIRENGLHGGDIEDPMDWTNALGVAILVAGQLFLVHATVPRTGE